MKRAETSSKLRKKQNLRGRIEMAIQKNEYIKEKEYIASMIEWLADYGKTKNQGVTRLLYSDDWLKAQQALKMKMDSAGFATYFDSVGNLFGRIEGREHPSTTVLTGSHIDTVVEGGKYDGAYGVIASFLAVKRLYELYGAPKKTIEVVSFCEEEGSRFPITFWGSRNVKGVYTIQDVQSLRDSEGISFVEAMRSAGFDPLVYTSPVRHDIESFVEVHIEQGIILEKNKNALGIVSHIVGQRRYSITITGESNHAGTTPMKYRKDALYIASNFISFLTNKAKEIDKDLVATVGKMAVSPNVPNVIVGEVTFSLDIRHYKEDILDIFCDEIFTYLENQERKWSIGAKVEQWMDVKPVAMDEKLSTMATEIAYNNEIPHQSIISGAGHDAQVFGSFCPTCLLFVPSKNGISHSPKEFTQAEDLEKGIEVLSELLYKLAY